MVPEKLTVVLSGAPAGVNVAGLKLHVTEAGRPEHEKLIAVSKPFAGVMVRVAVAAIVFVSVPLPGVIDNEKSGRGAEIVTVTALEVEAAKPATPPYCAVIVCVPSARVVVDMEALPVEPTDALPMGVLPSLKVTVPVGTVVPEVGETSAASIMLVPVAAEVGVAVRLVVVERVPGAFTVMPTAEEVLALKVVSPWYAAVILCAPAESAVVV